MWRVFSARTSLTDICGPICDISNKLIIKSETYILKLLLPKYYISQISYHIMDPKHPTQHREPPCESRTTSQNHRNAQNRLFCWEWGKTTRRGKASGSESLLRSPQDRRRLWFPVVENISGFYREFRACQFELVLSAFSMILNGFEPFLSNAIVHSGP